MIASSSKSFGGLVFLCKSRTLHCKQLSLNCKDFTQRLYLHISAANQMARRWTKEIAFQSELSNPVEVVYGSEKKAPDDFGVVYDKKPFKINVKKYHLYTWCGCGRSHSQPFCDGTHNVLAMRKIVKGGPVKYIAPEDREIWFCMCKQTKHRPFCDGSHRDEEIQEKRLDAKHEMWDPTLKNELRSKTILDSEAEELDILDSIEETNETTTS